MGQEAGKTLLAEAAGAVGCGISADEGESDRAVDSGKNGRSPRPEAVEQAAQLVGENDPLGDEIVPPTHQYPQRADIVRDRAERTEAVSIGAQDIGEHIGVAGIGFAASGAVSKTREPPASGR